MFASSFSSLATLILVTGSLLFCLKNLGCNYLAMWEFIMLLVLLFLLIWHEVKFGEYLFLS